MSKPKPKKARDNKRDVPDLPSEFETVTEDLGVGSVIVLQEKQALDLDQSNRAVDIFQIDGSVLERVQLQGGQFSTVVWKDVRLVGCDLANVLARRITCIRVEFIDCRLTGIRANTLDWQDVLVKNSDLRYAQLPVGKFRSCEFDTCNCQEADLQQSDLTGTIFRNCNLTRTDVRQSRLMETDFRGSDLDGMLFEVRDLQGAIIEPVQALTLVRTLGLQVK